MPALLAEVNTKVEAQLRETYQRYKDSLLVRDTLC